MPVPNLLGLFENYLSTAFGIDAIEPVSPQPRSLLADLSPAQQAALHPLFEFGGDSMALLWQTSEQVAVAASPVVWIDSEGTPNGVLAASLAEFLSILPYGTGTLVEILRTCVSDDYADATEIRQVLLERYSSEEISQRLTEHRQDYRRSLAFSEWLANEAGITLAPNPAAIIEQAVSTFPNFDAWLKQSS